MTQGVLALQEGTLLAARSLGGVWRGPRYAADAIRQMDSIGCGSAAIVLLTGFFTGAVLCVQTYPSMKEFGAQDQTGQLVALALLRELGPIVTALMVAGRVGSAIAAELGSMVVSEQINALRALGVDPVRKLVAPRLFALLTMLPVLTLFSNAAGIVGGSGGGKSTLIKVVLGLLKPDAGRVLVDGEDITDYGGAEMMRVRGKIGMVFQEGALFYSLSVY